MAVSVPASLFSFRPAIGVVAAEEGGSAVLRNDGVVADEEEGGGEDADDGDGQWREGGVGATVIAGDGERGRRRVEDVAPLRAVYGAYALGAVSSVLERKPALLVVEYRHERGGRQIRRSQSAPPGGSLLEIESEGLLNWKEG